MPWLRPIASIVVAFAVTVTASAQKLKTHRLEATPKTIAYGHYWSETKPVLRIASGDIIDVTVKDRGPGGHILTGPVYVEGAEPGNVLEVRVLSIALPIAYGYNGCSGVVRENGTANGTRIIPLKPFFGSRGVAPPPPAGRINSAPPWIHAGNLDNKELIAGTTRSSRFTCLEHCFRSATDTRHRGTARSTRQRSKPRSEAASSGSSART
ncbi:MAG: hypothetical protein ABIS06_11955 [Vicinamibacterales bacterium]